MRLIIVHGFMNNVYHKSSCMITIDHCHERLLIMYHNCCSLPWKTVDHVSQLLIIALKDCWSYMIIDMHHFWSCITTVDHVHETPLIIHHKHWSLPWKPVDHVSQLLIIYHIVITTSNWWWKGERCSPTPSSPPSCAPPSSRWEGWWWSWWWSWLWSWWWSWWLCCLLASCLQAISKAKR